MTLPQAIERAKSALKDRIARAEHRIITDGSWLRRALVEDLKERINTDTEALQTLREWRDAPLGQPDSAPTGEGREE